MKESRVAFCCFLLVIFSIGCTTQFVDVSGSDPAIAVARPTWKINDQWVYQRKMSDGKITYNWTLTVRETGVDFDGHKNCYKLQYQSFDPSTGQEDLEMRSFQFYDENLVYLGLIKGSEIIRPYEGNLVNRFNWPLAPGKEWRQAWYDRTPSGYPWPCQTILKSESDKVAIPAGQFDTVKITQIGSNFRVIGFPKRISFGTARP